MSNFDWNQDNDDEGFADRPQELVNGQWQEAPTETPAAKARSNNTTRPTPRPATPVVQESQEELHEETPLEEDDYTTVLSDAKLRLAQGSLYELLINNSLFQDLDIDPKAVRNVEKEVKAFAKERMEIMLGMRQEQMAKQYSEFSAQLASPFNDLEVEALKALASAATKGATQAPEAQTFSGPQPPPKRGSLTPISMGATRTRPVPTPAKPAQKLPSKPVDPIKRTKLSQTIEQIAREEGIPIELLEKDFAVMKKPVEQMTEQEIIDRNTEATVRLAKKQSVKSASAIPMPDLAQQEMIYTQRANDATSRQVNPQMANLMSLLTTRR